MRDRDAISTIKGYFYQFDFFILKLLEQDNNSTKITIEGIEDVDVKEIEKTQVIQCKYYEGTEYNHSVIAKPLRLMLLHYKNTDLSKRSIEYRLYGFYKSGQDKMPAMIDSSFAKDNFFTYTMVELF